VKNWHVLWLAAALAACTSAPVVVEHPDYLFQDDRFVAPTEPIKAADVFALSPDMRQYLKTDVAARMRIKGLQRGLFDALYDKQQLKLVYDAQVTRNAAQTFAARAGNCLSLVIMTAAFAKEIGVPVRYQRVLVDDAWSRSGDYYFSSAHVNLTLDSRDPGKRTMWWDRASALTIDFLGPEDIGNRGMEMIDEGTVLAMYMNNRAAEALALERLDDAYWWARAAIVQDPSFLKAYDTLGAVYYRHGNLEQAERVLNRVLALQPQYPQVMSNLVLVLRAEGRFQEAAALALRLDELDPHPPFYFFNLGLVAMRDGDFLAARKLFTREVDRDETYHEFHFWLAAADLRLGKVDEARTQLALAMESSPTHEQHELYAAKLDRIRALQPH
jgi:Flp pilus assembly protein TadD